MSTAAISFRRRVLGNARHHPQAAIGVVLILIFLIFALFAPWITPQDPAAISLLVGASVVATSLILGLIIGSIAGYYGGGIDRFFNVVVMNAFLSFPGIL